MRIRIAVIVSFAFLLLACQTETTLPTVSAAEKLSPEDLKNRERWIPQLKKDLSRGKDKVIWQAVAPSDTPSKLCELGARYNKLVATVTLVRTVFGPRLHITWADLDTTETSVEDEEQRVGAAYARELIKLIKTPIEARKHMGGCYEENALQTTTDSEYSEAYVAPDFYKLSHTYRLLSQLDRVLYIMQEKEETFGTTRDELRKIVRRDCVTLLGETKGKERDDILHYAFSQGFSREDFGLPPD